MRRQRRRSTAALLSVLVALSALSLPLPAAGRDVSPAEALDRARALVGRQVGIAPDELRVSGPADQRVRLGDRHFRTLVLATPDLREQRFVAVDLASGDALDADAFAALTERHATEDRFSPAARLALERAATNEPVLLAFGLRRPSYGDAVGAYAHAHGDVRWIGDRPETPNRALAETRRLGVLDAKRQVLATVRRPFLDAARAAGATVTATLDLVPMVYLEATAAVAKRLAARDDVAEVLRPAPYELAMSAARPAVDADIADKAGWDGSGVRIGIVEYAYVRWSHTGLSTVPHSSRRVSADGRSCISGRGTNGDSVGHMTWVTAIAASRASSRTGIANNVYVIDSSANSGRRLASSDARILKAAECAVQAGANVLNLSIVQNDPSNFSTSNRFFDELVDEHGISVIVASGDHGPAVGAPSNPEHCPDAKVRSPASAWNVVTVGGYDDRGTFATGDDRLWWRSDGSGPAYCWQEPAAMSWDPVNDREEPDLSAPASRISTSTGHSASGTSASAPIVTGAVATLQEHDPTLRYEPDRVRAILIAGARRDRTPRPDRTFSTDQEGFGSLNVYWSNLIVNRKDRGGNGRLNFRARETGDTACPYGVPAAQVIPFTAKAGRVVRWTITWNSHVISGSDRRTTDYDLTIRNPQGKVVSTSARRANNVEVIDFAVDVYGGPGVYRAEIVPVRWQCNPAQEGVAWAWASF